MNEKELCKCASWANMIPDYNGITSEHHIRCEHYKPIQEAKNHIEALIKGIEEWGNEEDGIPDFLWEQYKHALHFVDFQKWTEIIQREKETLHK